MRFEGKEETSPDEVQPMMLVIAQKVDVRERARALDLEGVRRITGDKHLLEKKKHRKIDR